MNIIGLILLVFIFLLVIFYCLDSNFQVCDDKYPRINDAYYKDKHERNKE